MEDKVREAPREEGEKAPIPLKGEAERGEYSHITDKELRDDLRRRRFKVKGRKREEMILLLEEDDKNQRKLVLTEGHWRGQGGSQQIRGVLGEGEEGKRGGDTTPSTGEDGEDFWVDVNPQDQTDNGRGTEEVDSPNEGLRRNSPLKHLGRLRGQGRRGYWVGKRAQQVLGRIKSTRRGDSVNQDSKSTRENRVKRAAPGTEAGPGADVKPCATTGAKSAEVEKELV